MSRLRSALPAIASAIVPLVLALVPLVSLLRAAPLAAEERLVEGIAAQVGNEIILASEVMEYAAPVEERLREAGAPPQELFRVRVEALERLIEARLLSSVVDRLELGASREEVDGGIQAIADNNGISVEQLLASIQSHGLSVEEYREKIREDIERNKVVGAMVRSRVQVSDEEVEALYAERFGEQREGGEELRLRHLVVMAGEQAGRDLAEACRMAEQARSAIVSGGEDFPDVARRVTELNRERGGELGWMHREDLASWMAEHVESLEPGQTSGVIEMPFGCNVLQLVDRRGFEPVSFEAAQDELRNLVFQRKIETEYTKWLDVLRDQTYIERKGPFGSGSRDG